MHGTWGAVGAVGLGGLARADPAAARHGAGWLGTVLSAAVGAGGNSLAAGADGACSSLSGPAGAMRPGCWKPAAAGAFQATTQLPGISTTPSLGWSEASRYYYASLCLSDRIYGFRRRQRAASAVTCCRRCRFWSQLADLAAPAVAIAAVAGLPLLTAWLLARRLRLLPVGMGAVHL
jgi:hypothetical protein